MVSVDGALGKEADSFVRYMAGFLAQKWDKTYAEVVGWLRASLSFQLFGRLAEEMEAAGVE